MAITKIEVEADTLEQAKEALQLQMPEGTHLIKQNIISTGIAVISASGDTEEEALADVQARLPPNTVIVEKRLRSTFGRDTVIWRAFNEEEAKSHIRQLCSDSWRVSRFWMAETGNKGILGIGKSPNVYKAEMVRPGRIEISYRTKAKISAEIGNETDYLQWNALHWGTMYGSGAPSKAEAAVIALMNKKDFTILPELRKIREQISQEMSQEDTSDGGLTIWQVYGEYCRAIDRMIEEYSDRNVNA
jgi:hypothetical protein